MSSIGFPDLSLTILAFTLGFLAVKGVATVAMVYVGARLAIRHERRAASR